ncbi:thiopurine S-methyltransferase [Gluconobacter albidus]|uniref:Thiopurine S-methyltransferase n=1 Tax=Gluconobacter albidus TaxID=318683 RepID=A0A149TGS8_9PROT|nr:thiopurine S-methyltransferase [Gluconobacter albidus]KXV47009.1 thiopurine S-methyltransferase [Gluconobacter albidus]
MDVASNAVFWQEKWERGETGFHEAGANPLLTRHIAALDLSAGARIFVPLCGMSQDMVWLAGQGYRVIGCELSDIAVRRFFDDLGVTPDVVQAGLLRCFSAGAISVFAGNIFDLTSEVLGPVEAIYDRAAVIALPEDLRRVYVTHLLALTGPVPELLVTLAYDQSRLKGPPFSVDEGFVREVYGEAYGIRRLESREVPGGLKGRCPATENVWQLSPLPVRS